MNSPQTSEITLPRTDDVAPSRQFPWLHLLTLAFAVGATVTAEMIPAGVMPAMSESFGVPPIQIGLLVTVWAFTIIVSSVPLARLTTSIDRRRVVAFALIAFAVANVGTALAPIYEVVVASRVLAAMSHGLFWAIVMVYAATLVPNDRIGRAIAIVSGGVTVATVVGLPAGTALAQVSNWRMAFAGVAVLMTIVAIIVLRVMPPSYAPGSGADRSVPRLWRDRGMLPVMGIGSTAALMAFGHFALFTYITPYLDLARFDESWTSAVLLSFGVAGAIGLVAGGLAADRWPAAALVVTLTLFTISLLILSIAGDNQQLVIAGIVAWGASIGSLPSLLQTQLMRVTPPRLQGVGSAALVVFFNIGIGLGAFFGGVVDAAAGPRETAILASISVAASVVVAVLTALGARRRAALVDAG